MSKGIKIALWSIVAILLTAVLCAGIAFGGMGFELSFGGNMYKDADKYTVGGGTLAGNEVSWIKVGWVSGSVTVMSSPDGGVEFYEEYSGELKERNRMRYYLDADGVLRIQFRQASLFSFGKIGQKNLIIKIPSGKELTIEAVSADIAVDGVETGKLKLETVSGDCNITNVKASAIGMETVSGEITASGIETQKDIDAESVSGDIELTNVTAPDEISTKTVSGSIAVAGDTEKLDAESISGSMKAVLLSDPRTIDAETVSGSITLTVPGISGFTADMDTVSGKFDCDFPTVQKDRKYIYADGSADYSFETVSGSVHILKSAE